MGISIPIGLGSNGKLEKKGNHRHQPNICIEIRTKYDMRQSKRLTMSGKHMPACFVALALTRRADGNSSDHNNHH